MDELEELLGNLGKDVGGSSTATVLGDDDRVMSRIKERRISRRMATKTGGELQPKNQIQTSSHLSVQTPAARPTSGLEDLGDLMSELGVGPSVTNPRASGASQSIGRLSTKPAPQAAPVSAQPKPVGFHDEIDNLMAALSLTPQSQPQARQQQSQPIRQSVPPQQVKAPLDDPLLGDISALMESLGPIQTSPAPTYQVPKPQQYSSPPQHMSKPYPVTTSTGPSADPDLDALISSLNPDPLVATAPARSPQPTAGRVDSPQDLSNLFRNQMTDMNAGAPAAKGICATCKRPIHAQMMQALGKTYHVDCFVCGNCGDSLGTSSFYQSGDGTPNCRKCHEALFCARCAHCDQAIQGNCITAVGKKWHVNCFICAQCLRPFGTNLVYEKEGNPFCESCFYGIFSSRCAGCDQPIKADCINACGKQWHVEHFVCTYCKKAFGTEPYFEHAGLPYCKLHYHQQQGSLCGCGCGRPVMGRVVQALGKQWLPEHFICGYCMNGLAGQTFTERDGKAYCSVCYGKLFS